MIEKLKVKDIMTLAEDLPRISDKATFAQAVLALEQAQEDFAAGKKRQRIVLVYNQENKIVGKVSPKDLLRGLEPGYGKLPMDTSFSSAVESYENVMKTLYELSLLWSRPLEDLCCKARDIHVNDFMKHPTEAQTVKADAGLSTAVHRFVMGRYDSLFVAEDGKLVGMLLFSDVYQKISQTIKKVCEL